MENKFIENTKIIICILLIIITAITLIPKHFENDIFFDLKTGENILKYGIDFKDHFSFSPNLTYIYHHWLYDIIIHSIKQFSILFIFFTVTYTLFGIIIFYVNSKRKNKFISIILTIFTMYICAQAFQTRVQSVTYILFFLEIYFLEKLYKTGKIKYSIYLILMAILIVNIHMPLWIIYTTFTIPYITETIIYLISKKIKFKTIKIEKPNNNLIITFLILLFTGLLSPLKLYPYTFITKVINNENYLIISEMKKTILYYKKIELLLIMIITISSYIKIIKLNIREFILIIYIFVLSLIAQRNIVFFYIIVPTIYLKNVNFNIKFKNENIKEFINDIKLQTKKVNLKIVNTFTTILLTTLTSYLIINFSKTNKNFNIETYYPDKTVKYIKENLDYKKIKLYNEFDYGSYLEYHDIPVFIDSRAEVYMKEFSNKDIISDYIKIEKYNYYKKIFKKYNFDYALVYSNTDIYYYLKKDKDFKIIFKEKGKDEVQFTLFKKEL